MSRQRVIEISGEIIKRKLPVIWKMPAGLKAEEVNKETLEWMSKSGLRYLSFSPESGSTRILSMMKKKFDYQHGLWLLSACHKLKIKTQACFILGMLTETDEDLKLTKTYLKKLAGAGLDEIVVFILCPLPGSEIFESGNFNFSNYEDLNFTPVWRKDFKTLDKNRSRLYLHYFFWKTLYHPLKVLRHLYNLLRGYFETKSEMTIYRILRQRWIRRQE